MSRSLFLSLAATLALGAPLAHGSEVYQWKDANGVTHYSQTPPPKGSYQQRHVSNSGSSTPLKVVARPAPASQNPQCDTARSNLAALAGEGPVQIAGEDGQPTRALNDAERASQLELAKASVRAYCNGATG